MDYFVYLVYRTFTALVGFLPLTVAYRLGQALGFVGYGLCWPYRRLAIANLTLAYGEALSRPQIRRLARTHFMTLGANLLCSIKAAGYGPDDLHRIATVEGMETIRAALERGKGVVLIISHIGNWELFAQLCQFLPEYPWATVYQPLGNRFIEGHIQRMRGKVTLFSRKNGFSAPTAFLRAGGRVGSAGRSTRGRRRGVDAVFRKTGLHVAAGRVARAAHGGGTRPAGGAHRRGGALAGGDLDAGAACRAGRRPRHARNADGADQPGAREPSHPYARRLVLGPQPVEDTAAEIFARHLPARDRPAAGGCRRMV